MKRLSADDSADSRVKVGHRQALTASKTPRHVTGRFHQTSDKNFVTRLDENAKSVLEFKALLIAADKAKRSGLRK